MGSTGSSVFELTVPSRMEELGAVQRLVERAIEAFGLDPELAHWIELAVNESAINAIQHGNRLDPSKDIFLRISSQGGEIEVIVEDQGDGFNLTEIPDPTEGENLLKPCGRGILIIRAFMDRIEVTPLRGGGSRLRMIKNIENGHVI